MDRIPPKPKAKKGPASGYSRELNEQARKLCLLGAIDAEIADFFNVSVLTLNRWKQQFPSFLEALKAGKMFADSNVGHRLYQRACGYTHPEERIFISEGVIVRANTKKHYPPDTTACIFWLKNRRPDLWRDRHEVTGKDGIPLFDLTKLSDNELSSLEQYIAKAAAYPGTNPGGKGPTLN